MKRIRKIRLILVGAASLIWFLIRVIPKPSRATYPCQQAAFPIASAFVIWLTAVVSSSWIVVLLRKKMRLQKLNMALGFLLILGFSTVLFSLLNSEGQIFASKQKANPVIWQADGRLISMNTNMTLEQDTVAIIRAQEAQASVLDRASIELLVAKVVEQSGGLSSIVKNGDQVILKPNLVALPTNSAEAYKEVSGMTTDWRVTRAMAKIVRALNPDGKIWIVESAAASSTKEVFEFYAYTPENFPMVDAICGHVMSLDPTNASYMVYLDQGSAALGTIDTRFIRNIGLPLSDIREVFPHSTEVTQAAVYSDYIPPEISILSSNASKQTLAISLSADSDLVKVELLVNEELLSEVCVKDFDAMVFHLENDLEAADKVEIVGYDRFFNRNKMVLDYSSIVDYVEPTVMFSHPYPNPFTEEIRLEYSLPKKGAVKLEVLSLDGRLVANLINEEQSSGAHMQLWKPANLPKGNYFISLSYEGERLNKTIQYQ